MNTTILQDNLRGFRKNTKLMPVSEKQLNPEEKLVIYKGYNKNEILYWFLYLEYFEAGCPTHFLLGVTTEQNEIVFAQKCFVAYNVEK